MRKPEIWETIGVKIFDADSLVYKDPDRKRTLHDTRRLGGDVNLDLVAFDLHAHLLCFLSSSGRIHLTSVSVVSGNPFTFLAEVMSQKRSL